MSHKCPYCGSTDFQKIDPPNGDTFFLMSVNRETMRTNPIEGAFIDAYACFDCKGIVLKSEFIEHD